MSSPRKMSHHILADHSHLRHRDMLQLLDDRGSWSCHCGGQGAVRRLKRLRDFLPGCMGYLMIQRICETTRLGLNIMSSQCAAT